MDLSTLPPLPPPGADDLTVYGDVILRLSPSKASSRPVDGPKDVNTTEHQQEDKPKPSSRFLHTLPPSSSFQTSSFKSPIPGRSSPSPLFNASAFTPSSRPKPKDVPLPLSPEAPIRSNVPFANISTPEKSFAKPDKRLPFLPDASPPPPSEGELVTTPSRFPNEHLDRAAMFGKSGGRDLFKRIVSGGVGKDVQMGERGRAGRRFHVASRFDTPVKGGDGEGEEVEEVEASSAGEVHPGTDRNHANGPLEIEIKATVIRAPSHLAEPIPPVTNPVVPASTRLTRLLHDQDDHIGDQTMMIPTSRSHNGLPKPEYDLLGDADDGDTSFERMVKTPSKKRSRQSQAASRVLSGLGAVSSSSKGEGAESPRESRMAMDEPNDEEHEGDMSMAWDLHLDQRGDSPAKPMSLRGLRGGRGSSKRAPIVPALFVPLTPSAGDTQEGAGSGFQERGMSKLELEMLRAKEEARARRMLEKAARAGGDQAVSSTSPVKETTIRSAARPTRDVMAMEVQGTPTQAPRRDREFGSVRGSNKGSPVKVDETVTASPTKSRRSEVASLGRTPSTKLRAGLKASPPAFGSLGTPNKAPRQSIYRQSHISPSKEKGVGLKELFLTPSARTLDVPRTERNILNLSTASTAMPNSPSVKRAMENTRMPDLMDEEMHLGDMTMGVGDMLARASGRERGRRDKEEKTEVHVGDVTMAIGDMMAHAERQERGKGRSLSPKKTKTPMKSNVRTEDLVYESLVGGGDESFVMMRGSGGDESLMLTQEQFGSSRFTTTTSSTLSHTGSTFLPPDVYGPSPSSSVPMPPPDRRPVETPRKSLFAKLREKSEESPMKVERMGVLAGAEIKEMVRSEDGRKKELGLGVAGRVAKPATRIISNKSSNPPNSLTSRLGTAGTLPKTRPAGSTSNQGARTLAAAPRTTTTRPTTRPATSAPSTRDPKISTSTLPPSRLSRPAVTGSTTARLTKTSSTGLPVPAMSAGRIGGGSNRAEAVGVRERAVRAPMTGVSKTSVPPAGMAAGRVRGESATSTVELGRAVLPSRAAVAVRTKHATVGPEAAISIGRPGTTVGRTAPTSTTSRLTAPTARSGSTTRPPTAPTVRPFGSGAAMPPPKTIPARTSAAPVRGSTTEPPIGSRGARVVSGSASAPVKNRLGLPTAPAAAPRAGASTTKGSAAVVARPGFGSIRISGKTLKAAAEKERAARRGGDGRV